MGRFACIMTDKDEERQRHLAIALAEAHLVVLACQEQVAQRAAQLAQARAAMEKAKHRLIEAKKLQDWIASTRLLWDKGDDP